MSPDTIAWLSGVLFAAIVAFAYGYVLGDRHGTKDTERRWSEAVGRAQDSRSRTDEAAIAAVLHEQQTTEIICQYILESYRHAAVQTWFVCSVCTCACNVPAGIAFKDLRDAISWHLRKDCPGTGETRGAEVTATGRSPKP